MLNISSATIEKIIIHQVGNIGREEACVFSEASVKPSASLETLLLEHYLLPLSELEDAYEFKAGDLTDVIAGYAKEIFTADADFHDASIKIAGHLHSMTNHPNIMGGDFIIILFDNIFMNSKETKALGLFKVESKDDYLDIYDNNGTLEFIEKEGISLRDIQKGALIFASDESVLAIDSQKRRTKYWHDDFLSLKPKQTEHAELKASNDILRGLNKRIATPEQRLEFNKSLESHLEEHDDIRFKDLENFSKPYVEEQEINRVFNAVQNKAGFAIDREISVPSHQFREQSKNTMQKASIAEGIELVIRSKDTYIDQIEIVEDGQGFTAIIKFDVYEPEES
ncbi:nucleoid-associated protein [Wohlfahrtiimonas populi]|uniref:hypothetical protein n=1 Tax=Wohlfahrtiimonas populi TaxID=1940240 RepID=UPI00098D39C5|nr:hypothetical protein [Wohlfahrtiimonas populi]